jgi:hypothetical protein
MLGLLEGQFKTMRDWLTPLIRNPHRRGIHARQVVERFERMARGYGNLAGVLRERFNVDEEPPETAEEETENTPDGGTAPDEKESDE